MFKISQVLTPAEKEYVGRVAYQAAAGDYHYAGNMIGSALGCAMRHPTQARQVFLPLTPEQAAASIELVRQDNRNNQANQKIVDAYTQYVNTMVSLQR